MLSDNYRQSIRNMYFKSRKFHRYFPYILLESIDRKLLGEYIRLQHAYRRLRSRLLYACLRLSRHVCSVLNDYLFNVYQLSV